MPAQIDRALLATRPTKALERLVACLAFEGRPLTTRGRWINPLVLAWCRVWTRVPETGGAERPVLVLGTGRSGTTWLARVLGVHRALSFLNEPKALWHAVHPGQDVIGSYARAAGRLVLTQRDATPEVARRARRLYGAFARLTRGKRVLDKYPEMLFRVPFVRALFPDASFVVVVRDGWSTARSIARWSESHARTAGGARHDWWGLDGRKWRALVTELVPAEPDLAPAAEALLALESPQQRAALEWTLGLRAAARLAGGAGVHLVRLEDLLRAPEATLEGLTSACGLAHDARVLAFARRTLAAPAPARPFSLPAPLAEAFARTAADFGYA
jgi:hypothetical protein